VAFVTVLAYTSCSARGEPGFDQRTKEVGTVVVSNRLRYVSDIRTVMQDAQGRYWIGSDREGACMFDGKAFTYYSVEDGLCGLQVIQIREDASGTMWFLTSNGLCRFDGKRFARANPLGSSLTTQISDTDLWFPGDSPGSIVRVNRRLLSVHDNVVRIPVTENPANYGITQVQLSRSGGLWVGHLKGVVYYHGNRSEVYNDSTFGFNGNSMYMHVRSLLEDSKGRLWIGNNGIGVQLKQGSDIQHFSALHGLVKGEVFAFPSPPGTLMHVFAITEDSKGNIWFGDRDTGAWRYDGNRVTNYVVDSTLNSQHIWDIYEDRNGRLLFAMAAGGVYECVGDAFRRVF